MRLKPKRCSMRKVLYSVEGQVEQAADQREGGQQRELVGHVAQARLHGVAHGAVERIQPAQQRPAQQHGGAEGRAQQAEAALGERVVGGLLVRGERDRRRRRRPAPRRGARPRGASGAWPARTSAPARPSSAAAKQRGSGARACMAASVGLRECPPHRPPRTTTHDRMSDTATLATERPEPDLDRPRDDRPVPGPRPHHRDRRRRDRRAT